MKKKIIIIAAVCVALIVGVLFSVHTIKTNDSASETNAKESALDLATQNVITDNLLIKNDNSSSNKSLTVNSYYYDGIRLYLSVFLQDAKDLKPDSFCLKSNSFEANADIVYSPENIESVTGEKEENYIVIFNCLAENSTKYSLSYGDISTDEFYINENSVGNLEINTESDVVNLKYVKFGTTCTLINCDISAIIDGSSFKFQVENNIFPAYLVSKDENNYSLLVPMSLYEGSEGYLIVNDQKGNVELRALIKLESKDTKETI